MKQAVEKYAKDPSRYSANDLRGMLEGTAGAGWASSAIVLARTPEKRAQLVKDIEEMAEDEHLSKMLKSINMGNMPDFDKCTVDECATQKVCIA
jgi:hypothetical protein